MAGYLCQPPHVFAMDRDALVDEMLNMAASARAKAKVTQRADYAEMLLSVASDYEQLAQCALTLTDMQRRLATSRPILVEAGPLAEP